MTREEAKDLFRKDKDAYGKPKAVMSKINAIYDDFEVLSKKMAVAYAVWYVDHSDQTILIIKQAIGKGSITRGDLYSYWLENIYKHGK
jgi:hypothetical protein